MENREALKQTYNHFITESTQQLGKVKSSIYRIGSLRLVLFILGVAGLIYFRHEGWIYLAPVAAVTFIPFLWLVKFHNKLFYKKEYLEKKIAVNEAELQVLAYDYSAFDDGEEFIDPINLYTYDLDVFGRRSLFQAINRTSTEMGKRLLAEWFMAHLKKKEDILLKQEAVRELAPELKFRQRFRIQGLLHKGEKADSEEIAAWAESPVVLRSNLLYRLLPHFILGVNLVLLLLACLQITTFSLWGGVFVGCAFLSMGFTKRISTVQSIYGKKLQIIGTYGKLISLIEEQKMNATYLCNVRKALSGNSKSASQSVSQLERLMNALDQRNNVFVAFMLNGFMCWELRQIMRIEAWKQKHAAELPRWLQAIAEVDALCSLSTFAYNNPDYCYAEIAERPFTLEAQSLGHPLMKREVCVHNDISMKQRPYFIIVTGANMAGKSTYLRTVGVNYLLACMGAPVCATSMTAYPAKLITSLRTTDSLSDNESYFFAELKRLKLIIDKLTAGEELFIILDEILKGTNSKDKQKGSMALVSQFMSLNANGIIATHDLLLGTLAQSFPGQISNFCFEADITDNELTFSYLMREGVAQNMNACFLMEKMGIKV